MRRLLLEANQPVSTICGPQSRFVTSVSRLLESLPSATKLSLVNQDHLFIRGQGPRTRKGGGGGAVLPSKRIMGMCRPGMCRWMGSHFHNWIDENGVTFLVELIEWGRTFSGFLG